ncbi:MAG: molybdopterin-dependent oxidoreductase, partial [Bdellovibrionales bacterium]|nr:molybdopterin-dependent oxidoreductase [Bdellovibrionales bacterium]
MKLRSSKQNESVVVTGGLVQIGSVGKEASAAGGVSAQTLVDSSAAEGGRESGLSRRGFLKILGSAPVVGAVGCSDSTKQKAYPNVFGQNDQVPGVSLWYSSTCTECSAGCGITVRTREGRAVKVEGNRENPLNRGGLCALGQSSLQALYDPDRIRQPLVKSVDATGKEVFQPISWGSALKALRSAVEFAKGETLLISGEQSGAIQSLTKDFVATLGGERVVYDPLQAVEVARASELVYGEYGIPRYSFENADVVLNFGADFLETFSSPVEYARGWADGRRKKTPTVVIHVEPRLSLTGANADKWLSAKPGTESHIALYLLKYLVEKGRGTNLADDVLKGIRALAKGSSMEQVARTTGVSEANLLVVAERLSEAKSTLVLSGGAVGRGEDGVQLATLVALLNLVLGNVGKTVDISKMRKPESNLSALSSGVDGLRDGKFKLLLVANGTNPAFALPAEYGFSYAVRDARVKQLKALSEGPASAGDPPFMVSFSSVLDETAKLADMILPSHHSLEDWGDLEVVSGARSLVQPVMRPVFDTRSFGEVLLGIARDAKLSLSTAGGAETYAAYVKNRWRKFYEARNEGAHGENGESELSSAGGFEMWWRSCLERGGEFSNFNQNTRVKVSVAQSALSGVTLPEVKTAKKGQLILYPYFSVKSFDGRAANRPWLQEM